MIKSFVFSSGKLVGEDVGLDFITGFYGMNFVDMPELQWRYPYLWILTLALMLSGAIYWLMRKMHWL